MIEAGHADIVSRVVHCGADGCILTFMAETRTVRRSVSLPTPVARRVKALVKTKKMSENRVLVELIESGLEAKEKEKERFFELAAQLTRSKRTSEQQKLKEELARLTFGD